MQPDRHTALAALLLSASACTFSTNGLDSPPPEAADASTSTQGTANPAATTETGASSSTSTSTPDTSTSSTAAPDPTSIPPGEGASSTGTLDPGECSGDIFDNEHCARNLPYCVDERCVDCTTLDCVTIAPTRPACDENTGLCVECLQHDHCANEAKPACDAETATCKPCTEHEECPATACDLETGKCMPEDCVYFVNLTKAGMFPCKDTADGQSPETPLCTLQKAATLLQPGKPCTIKVAAGTQNQSSPTEIEKGDFTVAIIQYGGAIPWLSVPNNPALTLNSGNRVYMNRIAIANAGDPAIECNDAVLWLDNQRIYNTATALHAKDCEVHVRRSILFGHTSGALDIQGTVPNKAQLWVENSYITAMNSKVFGAIRLIGSARADLLYTTIALVKGAIPPIECVVGFSGMVNIRNSAIIGPLPRYGAACMGKVTVTTSHESNEGTQNDLADTFASFADGQFKARVNGPLLHKALWLPGDPKTDQDGTPRPTFANTPDYAGADRPVP